MSSAILILFLLGIPGSSGQPEYRLAQAFEVDVEEDAEDIGDIEDVGENAKPKKQPEPEKVESEEDLWSEPEDKKTKKPKKEEDVEEVPDEGSAEKGSGEPGDVGGWGAEAERDTWGDEERIEKAESLMGKEEEPAKTREAGKKREVKTPVKKDPESTAGEASVEKKRTEEDLTELAEGQKKVVPLSGTLADLAATWDQRRIHLDQRDFELAQADLDRFVELKDDLDVRNMPLHANVLIREADRARQAEDYKKADNLFAVAVHLAPDFAGVHLARTTYWFSRSPFKVGRLFGGLADAAEASYRNPLTTNRLLVNLITGLLLGLGLAAAVFIVVQFLRYVNLYLHDFHHIFPRGVARLQTAFLGILVLLIPVLFRMGLLSVLLLWTLIAWIYQDRWERLVAFLVVVFLALSPFALKWVVEGMSVPESVVADLSAVARGPADSRSIARLKSHLNRQPEDYAALATLGGLYKRTGNLDLAEELLDRALKVRPDSAVLLNNRANIMFLKNDLKGAIGYYDRAIQARPDLAVPYFNISKAYYRIPDLDKGKHHRNRALRLDQERIQEVNKLAETRKANFVVADLSIPGEWITAGNGHRDGKDYQRATQHLWAAWGGAGSSESFPFIGAGVVVLFGLILLLRKKVYFSSGCVRCGRPACRRCSSELRDDSVCSQCFHVFVHREQGIDAKSRISKEIQIRQYRRRKENLARGINFLLPGVGQFIKGRPLLGILFLVVFCCVVVQVWLGHGLMRDAAVLDAGIDWLKLAPLLVLGAGFYAWAILNVFRSEV